MDYLINVYYEEEYICTLAAKYLKMYTEQIWWQLDKLIKAYRDKIITKELLLNTVEKCTDNFKVLPIDVPLNEIDNVIDFKKEVLIMPKNHFYDVNDFNKINNGCCKLVKKDGEYYIAYTEGIKIPLEKVEFDNIDLICKKILKFEEFEIVNSFLNDYTYNIIINEKILKFIIQC